MTVLLLLLIGVVAITIWAWYFERVMTWIFNRYPDQFSPRINPLAGEAESLSEQPQTIEHPIQLTRTIEESLKVLIKNTRQNRQSNVHTEEEKVISEEARKRTATA